MNLRTIATLTVVSGALFATACSDDEDSSNTTPLATAATTALVTTAAPPTTAAPATTQAPATTAAATTTAASPTTVAETTTTTEALPPGLPDFVALDAGAQYRIPRVAIGHGLLLTSPSDGVTGFSGRGGVALNDAEGDLLFALVDTPRSQVFTNPLDDVDTLVEEDTVSEAVSATPEDYLAAFAQLPGVEAGTPEPAELLGYEGQSMTFTIDTLDGGVECAGVEGRNCLLLFWLPSLNAINLRAGDTGTIYALDVDGKTVVAIVTDRPDAQTALDTMVVGP